MLTTSSNITMTGSLTGISGNLTSIPLTSSSDMIEDIISYYKSNFSE